MTGASSPRGAFIVLEGIDRCGKSTQAHRLVERLKGLGEDAELWSFPDRSTSIGKLIGSYLSNSTDLNDVAIHLLFSANRWEKSESLVQKLKAGTTVVVDRYAFSGAAYTAAKNIPGKGLEWCKESDSGLPSPDVVLYFRLSLEEAMKRGGYGGERYEKMEMQRQVLQKFEELQSASWQVIEAEKSPDEVAKQVTAFAMPEIERAKSGSLIADLWQ